MDNNNRFLKNEQSYTKKPLHGKDKKDEDNESKAPEDRKNSSEIRTEVLEDTKKKNEQNVINAMRNRTTTLIL
jgi:hypothetical protein